jgi:transcriptional regulator with XRE-family HTH domain
MSQRELAKFAGLSRATVGRVESDTIVPGMTTFRKLISAAGFDIAVIDQEGRRILPMEVWDDTLDGQERKFPAHLDLILDPRLDDWWGAIYGLARPPETFHRNRAARDWQRRLSQEDVRRRPRR